MSNNEYDINKIFRLGIIEVAQNIWGINTSPFSLFANKLIDDRGTNYDKHLLYNYTNNTILAYETTETGHSFDFKFEQAKWYKCNISELINLEQTNSIITSLTKCTSRPMMIFFVCDQLKYYIKINLKTNSPYRYNNIEIDNFHMVLSTEKTGKVKLKLQNKLIFIKFHKWKYDKHESHCIIL
jgi:hypothetical protein